MIRLAWKKAVEIVQRVINQPCALLILDLFHLVLSRWLFTLMWDEEVCVDSWAPPNVAYRTSRSVMIKKSKEKKGSSLYIPDDEPTSIGEPSLNTEMDASDGTMTFQPTKESTNELLSSLQTLVLPTLEQRNPSSRPITQAAADLHREDCSSTASTPTSASSAATTRTRCTRPSFAPVRPSSALRSEMTPRYEPPGLMLSRTAW